MGRGLFMFVCLLLALAVQHNVQTASANRTEETDPAPESWRKAVIDQLSGIKDALADGRSSRGGSHGAADAELAAGETKKENQMVSEMQKDLQKLKFRLQKIEEGQGSTFVRWGRTTCPANTVLVYSGVAAGNRYTHKGDGTNTLCMTRFPQYDNTPRPSSGYGYLHGAEYESIPGHVDHDVPCSVCRAPQSTTIMMAATLTCPQGWTAQYTGHLSSDRHEYSATEYVCLDGKPEHFPGGIGNKNGRLFYLVITACGNLPCPPYVGLKVITCVVCSK